MISLIFIVITSFVVCDNATISSLILIVKRNLEKSFFFKIFSAKTPRPARAMGARFPRGRHIDKRDRIKSHQPPQRARHDPGMIHPCGAMCRKSTQKRHYINIKIKLEKFLINPLTFKTNLDILILQDKS